MKDSWDSVWHLTWFVYPSISYNAKQIWKLLWYYNLQLSKEHSKHMKTIWSPPLSTSLVKMSHMGNFSAYYWILYLWLRNWGQNTWPCNPHKNTMRLLRWRDLCAKITQGASCLSRVSNPGFSPPSVSCKQQTIGIYATIGIIMHYTAQMIMEDDSTLLQCIH